MRRGATPFSKPRRDKSVLPRGQPKTHGIAEKAGKAFQDHRVQPSAQHHCKTSSPSTASTLDFVYVQNNVAKRRKEIKKHLNEYCCVLLKGTELLPTRYSPHRGLNKHQSTSWCFLSGCSRSGWRQPSQRTSNLRS